MRLVNFFAFVFFPILRVGGFPFPTPIFSVILMKRIEFIKEYFYPLMFVSIYILAITIINNAGDINFESIAYFVFPILYLLMIHGFMSIKNKDKLIKQYFFINLFIVLVVGLFKVMPPLLDAYYNHYIFGNIVTQSHYMENIMSRTVGLLGHPAWLGLMMYMLGKYLSYKEGKYTYVVLSAIGILLSSGRAALFTLVILEFITLFFNKRISIKKKLLYLTGILSLVSVLLVAIYNFNDSFRYWVDVTIFDLQNGLSFRSHSISHRLDMFTVLFEQNFFSLLFGGGIFSDSINVIKGVAVDSEIVMRSIQFGVIGYLLLYTPVIVALTRAKKKGDILKKEICYFLILFMFLGSMSTTIMSNMIFMIYISLIISSIESKDSPIEGQTLKPKWSKAI